MQKISVDSFKNKNMTKVFEVVKYSLIGKDLFTCEERPDLEMRVKNGAERYYYKDGAEASFSNLWEYSITPKEGAFSPKEKFLPYFADVTEDLPGSCKGLKPRTYKNCQLMTEKHGGYLQFWHEPTKQILRIAMNSHYYTPVK